MRMRRLGWILGAIVVAGLTFAGSLVDQGKPGIQGPWPVTLSGDGGAMAVTVSGTGWRQLATLTWVDALDSVSADGGVCTSCSLVISSSGSSLVAPKQLSSALVQSSIDLVALCPTCSRFMVSNWWQGTNGGVSVPAITPYFTGWQAVEQHQNEGSVTNDSTFNLNCSWDSSGGTCMVAVGVSGTGAPAISANYGTVTSFVPYMAVRMVVTTNPWLTMPRGAVTVWGAP